MSLPDATDGALRQPIPIERALARKVLGHLCTGVAVITGHDGRQPIGFTCQSVASVSVEPLYISFCRDKNWAGWRRNYQADAICVNILAAEQRDICARFEGGTGNFTGLQWALGANRTPVLDGTLAAIEAEIAAEHDAGDHTIVVAHVTSLRANSYREPLVIYRGMHGRFSRELGLDV